MKFQNSKRAISTVIGSVVFLSEASPRFLPFRVPSSTLNSCRYKNEPVMARKDVCLLLLLTALAISVASASPTASHRRHKLHHSMSNYHLEHFFNLKNLQDWEDHEYDLVTPSQTEEDGTFLSHDLGEAGLATSRRRRSAGDETDVTKEMFYKLHMFGEEHHLRLKRNDEMLHKNFMINIHDKDDMSTHTFDQACFYHGTVKAHGDSDVAMSNCDSELMGVVRKKREVFHVHPLPEYLKGSEHNPKGHSHLVYRVKEKKATGAAKDIYKHYGERQRRQAAEEPAPANKPDDIFCTEDDMPAGYNNKSLNVAYADTMALQLYEPGFVDRTFGQNYVHAAFFIDHTMVEKHKGDENFLIRYHLSMFNIMSLFYQPERTTYHVRLVLITLKIYRTPQSGLFITQNSAKLLEGFCRYQQTINPPRPSPWRWNHAFLITGYGLCFRSNRDCGELGRAPIEGVCIPDRECSVNREGGLNTAFVLAHELGHNLGMFHDGHPTEARSCPYQDGYLMAPSTGDAKRIWQFSPCSKAHLQRYLRSRDSSCMDKGSTGPTINDNLKVTDCRMPGEVYSADKQCELQFKHWANRYYAGHKFKFCSRTSYGRDSICRHLFCDDGNTRKGCFSTYTPAMDGTPCGDGRVCYRFSCVDKNTLPADYCAPNPIGVSMPAPVPQTVAKPTTTPPVAATSQGPVNGAWSPFSAYSECSQSCGPGLRFRIRLCNNPPPSNGGSNCQGSNREYGFCNMENCPMNKSYPVDRCRKYGADSLWVPVPPTKDTPAADQCKLICRDPRNGQTGVAVNKVPDGMPCYSGFCFNGTCSLGCDGRLNSGVKTDRCGMCGGDGSMCKLKSGTVDHILDASKVFTPVNLRGTGNALLRGSWDISILEKEATPSKSVVFALRDNNPSPSIPNYYYLNGPDVVLPTTGVHEFDVAGARGHYENIDGQPERLTITGYINRPLVVEVRVISTGSALDKSSLSVAFNFTSPVLPPEKKFFWRLLSDWGRCSVTCGKGIEGRTWKCINKLTDGTARDDQCIKAGKPKPVFYRTCYNMECRFVRTATTVSKIGQCKNCLRLEQRMCVAYDAENNSVVVSPRDCSEERLTVLQPCGGGGCSMTMSYEVTAMCASMTRESCTGDVKSVMCAKRCAQLNSVETRRVPSGETRRVPLMAVFSTMAAATLLAILL